MCTMAKIAEVFQKDEYEPGEEAKLETIEYVNVRKNVSGSWETIRRQFAVEEVATTEQLYDQVGPGIFELVARNSQNSRVVTRIRITLAAEPGDMRNQPAPVRPAVEDLSVPPPVTDSSDRMLMFMMQMQQAQAAQAATMMQGMMGMITAVLTTGNQNADKYTTQMAQMFTSFGQQQGALMQSVMQSAGAKDPTELFLKGIETAVEFRKGIEEGKEDEKQSGASELAETMNALGQGVELFSKVQGLGRSAPGPGEQG
jgi:hypothetical protein